MESLKEAMQSEKGLTQLNAELRESNAGLQSQLHGRVDVETQLQRQLADALQEIQVLRIRFVESRMAQFPSIADITSSTQDAEKESTLSSSKLESSSKQLVRQEMVDSENALLRAELEKARDALKNETTRLQEEFATIGHDEMDLLKASCFTCLIT
jgi:hypothetical protein